jgi:large subunit ribosomal protein L3
MLRGVWGKKIGMTQLFSNDKVVPVTVIDLSRWVVTQIKTADRDGYKAIQVGLVKDKFADKPFDTAWLKKSHEYFSFVREIKATEVPEDLVVGSDIDSSSIIKSGEKVQVTGVSKGRGFAGVVKRHGFAGGPASHGPRLGRRPGSVGFMRSQGHIIKGKKLPGHFGTTQHSIAKLQIVSFEPEARMVMVKGAVPGGKGSLVYLRKA